jgi:hypothetical protein
MAPGRAHWLPLSRNIPSAFGTKGCRRIPQFCPTQSQIDAVELRYAQALVIGPSRQARDRSTALEREHDPVGPPTLMQPWRAPTMPTPTTSRGRSRRGTRPGYEEGVAVFSPAGPWKPSSHRRRAGFQRRSRQQRPGQLHHLLPRLRRAPVHAVEISHSRPISRPAREVS